VTRIETDTQSMISALCLTEQHLKTFYSAKPPSALHIVEELEPFYRLAAELLGKPLPCIERVTMSHSPSFPVYEQNVLVPLSGGLASAAALWWCLRQGYRPFVFFADGLSPRANAAERRAVRAITLGARDQCGLPLCSDSADPQLTIMPWPYEEHDEALTAAQLYFAAQEVAKARGCCRIVWGALGDRQRLLRSLAPFFQYYGGERGTLLVQSVFPFSSPEAVMVALKECEALTERVREICGPGERPCGAVLPRGVTALCHSCVGNERPSWASNAQQRCQGCTGCLRWREVAAPDWRWDNGSRVPGQLLADYQPQLVPDPRPTHPNFASNAKRAALEPRIAAKRQKELEDHEQQRVNDAGKKRAKPKAKAKAAARPKAAAARKPKAKALELEDDEEDDESSGPLPSLKAYDIEEMELLPAEDTAGDNRAEEDREEDDEAEEFEADIDNGDEEDEEEDNEEEQGDDAADDE